MCIYVYGYTSKKFGWGLQHVLLCLRCKMRMQHVVCGGRDWKQHQLLAFRGEISGGCWSFSWWMRWLMNFVGYCMLLPLFENRSHWFNAGLIGMWLCLKEIGYPISPDYHFFCGKMQYFGIHPILRHIQTSYQFVFWYLYDMQRHTHYFVPCIIAL